MNKCLEIKAVDRPVLAELVIDPLFKRFVDLEPYEETKMIETHVGLQSVTHEGFKIG